MKSNLDVKFEDSKRSNQNFDAFSQDLILQMGAALGLPYKMIAQHFNEEIARINEK